MKAIIDISKLSKNLKLIEPAVAGNPIIPICECVKLSFDNGVLNITGTKISSSINIEMECECKTVFALAVSFKELKKVVERAVGQVTLTHKGTFVELVHDRGRHKLATPHSVVSFPEIDQVSEVISFEADVDFFSSLLFADSCKDSERAMTHRCFPAIDVQKDKISVVGCSGMSMFKKDYPGQSKKTVIVKLSEDFVSLTKTFQASTITIGEKHIRCSSGGINVVSQLMDGEYVNYSHVINKVFKFNMEVDRKDLVSAINIVAVTQDNSRAVQFIFSETELVVKSINSNSEEESESTLTYRNDEIPIESISFSTIFLLNLLTKMQSESIKFAVEESGKPVYLQPSDESELVCLIMPLVKM